MTDNKIYVFLSHSHHDYEKVRLVRNLLEDEGFRPLMFFLKCLDIDGFKELTQKLIKEEIDSRQRFILCRSENADRSEWVKYEVEHIIKTKRPYESINLDWPQDGIKNAIKQFKIRSSVFLSYPRKLQKLAVKVRQILISNDFILGPDLDDLSKGESFCESETLNIKIASKQGYVLLFLNEDIKEGSFQFLEIMYSMQRRGRIIPVVTTKNVPDIVKNLFYKINWIDISGMDNAAAAESIVHGLIRYDIHLYHKYSAFYLEDQQQ